MRTIVDKQVVVRESDRDPVDTQVLLRNGDEVDLIASGSIWAGVWFTGSNGPRGWMTYSAGDQCPLPGVPPFSLLGMTPDDGYFYIGDRFRRTYQNESLGSGAARLYLQINDDSPGNGSGAFRVRIVVRRGPENLTTGTASHVANATAVESFSTSQLLDALRTAQPGEQLEFGSVSPDQMDAAVRAMSEPSGSEMVRPSEAIAEPYIDLGPHVSTRSYWWGVRVEVDHEGMLALVAAGAAAGSLLIAAGVTAKIAVIIAGVVGTWYAFDRGNGVIFFVTWSGVHWFAPR